MMSEREDERASPPPKGADCSSAGESPGRVRCLRGGLMSDTDWVDPLARLRVVLIATSHPGNIGAAARALHTMGLSRLILVRPGHFPSDEATAMAAGGAKLLASASIVGSLAEALRGTVGSIAFTARARRGNDRLLPLAEVRADIIAQAQRGEVALVFGNEQAGLSNEELALCGQLATIPASPTYPVLNLAAAVQIVCYELRQAACAPGTLGRERMPLARFEDTEAWLARLRTLLAGTDLPDPAHPDRHMVRLRRLLLRARPHADELRLLHGVLSAWERRTNSD